MLNLKKGMRKTTMDFKIYFYCENEQFIYSILEVLILKKKLRPFLFSVNERNFLDFFRSPSVIPVNAGKTMKKKKLIKRKFIQARSISFHFSFFLVKTEQE